MKMWKNKVDDFFKWIKGTELVELDKIDVSAPSIVFNTSEYLNIPVKFSNVFVL